MLQECAKRMSQEVLGFSVMNGLKDILPILCTESEQFFYGYSTQKWVMCLSVVVSKKTMGLLTAAL